MKSIVWKKVKKNWKHKLPHKHAHAIQLKGKNQIVEEGLIPENGYWSTFSTFRTFQESVSARDKVVPRYGMWKNIKASHTKSSMESASACVEDIPFDFKEIKFFHNMECGRI